MKLIKLLFVIFIAISSVASSCDEKGEDESCNTTADCYMAGTDYCSGNYIKYFECIEKKCELEIRTTCEDDEVCIGKTCQTPQSCQNDDDCTDYCLDDNAITLMCVANVCIQKNMMKCAFNQTCSNGVCENNSSGSLSDQFCQKNKDLCGEAVADCLHSVESSSTGEASQDAVTCANSATTCDEFSQNCWSYIFP